MDRYTRDCMKKWCPSEEYIQENPSCYKWWFNTTETNQVPQSVSESARGRGGLGERMAPKRHWPALSGSCPGTAHRHLPSVRLPLLLWRCDELVSARRMRTIATGREEPTRVA